MLTCTGCLKTGSTHKQCNLYSYKTHINVNGCYWNVVMQTHVYYNLHMGTWTCSLVLMSM